MSGPGRIKVDPVQRLIDRVASRAERLAGPIGSRAERAWVHGWGHPMISQLAGRIADTALAGPVLRGIIRTYIRVFDVDMSDAAGSLRDFRTFNGFFTRALRPGARPIAQDDGEGDTNVLVSPADAVLTAAGPVGDGPLMPVKGVRCTAADLLAVSELPEALHGGQFCVLYLSPRDYHRVHSPVDGEVTRVLEIAGKTFPVNARGVRQVPGLLAINTRVVFEIDSPTYGRVWLVMVGATNVGRIARSVHRGQRVVKGDEIGVFFLGSTVVLLTERAPTSQQPDLGEHIRMGSALWRYPRR